MKIAVMGSGGWGTALAVLWHEAGREVTLWSAFEQEREMIRRDGENTRCLPGIRVAPDLPIETDVKAAVRDAGLVAFVVPSQFMRSVVERAAPHVRPDAVLLSAAKGLEFRGDAPPLRMTEAIADALRTHRKEARIAVMSGPSHAEEVGRLMPTTIVVAGEEAETIRDMCSTPSFRIYTSDDPIGVELGGALKNPIAIAAGIAAGLGAGDNAMGALVTRGMTEIARLGVAVGAKEKTFAGLSGIGDLVTTCSSRHSRNRRVGYELARGKDIETILADLGMVAEGVETARTVDRWGRSLGIETPITSAVARVLFDRASARAELEQLMTRTLKNE